MAPRVAPKLHLVDENLFKKVWGELPRKEDRHHFGLASDAYQAENFVSSGETTNAAPLGRHSISAEPVTETNDERRAWAPVSPPSTESLRIEQGRLAIDPGVIQGLHEAINSLVSVALQLETIEEKLKGAVAAQPIAQPDQGSTWTQAP